MPATPLPTIPQNVVARHSNEKSCYVRVGAYVYDITDFLEDHPGGPELILEHAGKDVEEIMKDGNVHEHSETAWGILTQPHRLVGLMATDKLMDAITETSEPATILPLMPNGRGMEILKEQGAAMDVQKQDILRHAPADDFNDPHVGYMKSAQMSGHKGFVDVEKPMLKQIWNGGFSKEYYLEEVHKGTFVPGGGSAPLFGNFLEPLSLTPWWVIPLLWYPCDAFLTYKANSGLSSLFETAFYWMIGLGLWTLVEYGMHRGLFHVDKYLPDNRVGITAHFLLHGIHHYLPMDRYRLVMPPALLVVLAIPFYQLAHAVFSWDWYVGTAVFAGGFFGYIGYDMTHYFLHHKRLPQFYQPLKRYHMEHHTKDHENGFGVTSRFWDVVFGTELKLQPKAAKAA